MKIGSELSIHLEGVIVKDLVSYPDDRGFFREIIRSTDPLFQDGSFGQWSHSRMSHNVVKAWHFHHRQTDWWYLGTGTIECVLVDNREESSTFGKKSQYLLGETSAEFPQAKQLCVRIPPGVLHGLKVLSQAADLFYVTSHSYNPDDEGRIPYDSPDVNHIFGEDVITTERDRKLFIPPFPRSPL